MIRYALTIFLSAFLLFQVQPLLAKYILPWFGGTPSLWTTCMLFFQILLLGGYAYAHATGQFLGARRQTALHIVLLAASLAMLPIVPDDTWKPEGTESPTWRIMLLLGATVGLPYFLLSTTGPMLQDWFSRTNPGRSPYRLYALSNVGSLLALLSYPFVVEPSLKLHTQALSWSWGYVAFVALCGWCAVQLWFQAPAAANAAAAVPAAPVARKQEREEPVARPGIGDLLLWLGLSAGASIMLLATTNQMCQEVAVVPFLWILPLALYLLSFIICFDNPRWYVRGWFAMLLVASATMAVVVLYVGVGSNLDDPAWLGKLLDFLADLRVQIAVYALVLFACAMCCHGELARWKPHPKYLTLYFLLIAMGGALGGVSVAIVAPRIFAGFWEFHVGLALCALLVLISYFRDPTWIMYRGKPFSMWALVLTTFAALCVSLEVQTELSHDEVLERSRNFYGVLKVSKRYDEVGEMHSLLHGRILHGYQYLDPEWAHKPTSYYGPNTAAGLALRLHPRRSEGPLRIGVIGLGTGSLAVYGQSGDYVRFYEINPDINRIAHEYFTYCDGSPATVEIAMGDARVQMERELEEKGSQEFDVLAVDAFSSDAIPMHLLTKECVELYFKHLKPDGILALHISNRNLDLTPVVRALAEATGTDAVLIATDDDDEAGLTGTNWCILTKNKEFLAIDEVAEGVDEWNDSPPVLWTDDFGSLRQVLTK